MHSNVTVYRFTIYGSCSDSQLHRVQKLLNFCARVISGRRKYDHISDVLRQLGWLNAKQLVSYHRLSLIKTALDTQLPADIAAMFSYVCTPHHTRQTGQLQCPRAKTCSGARRLSHASALFNRIPHDLQCLPRSAFKRRLRELLLREAG